MSDQHSPVTNNRSSWSCWTVNLTTSNKEQHRVANISLNPVIVASRIHTASTCGDPKLDRPTVPVLS